jgi:hypothetical protein
MKLAIVLGLALALSAQAPKPICPPGNFDGHWWLAANACERAAYLRGFLDGGGRVGQEDAIDRYYNALQPKPYISRAEQLNFPLRQVIRQIWGSADTDK